MGGVKMSFVNVVKGKDGTVVELNRLSAEERKELSEVLTDRFMKSMGYVKKTEKGGNYGA